MLCSESLVESHYFRWWEISPTENSGTCHIGKYLGVQLWGAYQDIPSKVPSYCTLHLLPWRSAMPVSLLRVRRITMLANLMKIIPGFVMGWGWGEYQLGGGNGYTVLIIKCVLISIFHLLVYNGHCYVSVNMILYRPYHSFYFSLSLNCSWLSLTILGVVNGSKL